jgi:MFS family permease
VTGTSELDPQPTGRVRGGLLRQREFGLLFAGQAVSVIGDRLVMVAMPFAVLTVPGAGLSDVGLVLGASAGAMALFVLVGGVWADRLPRHLTMLASDLVRAAAQGLTAVLLLTGAATVLQLVVLQAVYGAAEAFFRPAVMGLVPQVVDLDEVQPANALLALSSNVAMVAGPAAAGLLVALLGPGGAIAVDAATFVVSAASLVLLRPVPVLRSADPPAFLAELAGGWREVVSRSWVWQVVLSFSAYHAFVLPALFVLGPLYAQEHRGGSAAWGLISAGFGAGAVAGSLVALRWRPARPGVVIGGALCVSACQAWIVVAPLPTAVVALLEAVCGVAVALVFTIWETALQQRIPPAAQSRVSSFDHLGSLVLMPAGFVAVGPVGAALGTRTTALCATVLCLLVAGAVTASRGVRGLPRLERIATE